MESAIDWRAIAERVGFVADVLRLPDHEIYAALADEDGLIDFSCRHEPVSLDWILIGDAKFWQLTSCR
jgi:hypothetical protein